MVIFLVRLAIRLKTLTRKSFRFYSRQKNHNKRRTTSCNRFGFLKKKGSLPPMKKPGKKQSIAIIIIALLAAYYFCLPKTLFDDPYSTVLEDKNGELLSATIAA